MAPSAGLLPGLMGVSPPPSCCLPAAQAQAENLLKKGEQAFALQLRAMQAGQPAGAVVRRDQAPVSRRVGGVLRLAVQPVRELVRALNEERTRKGQPALAMAQGNLDTLPGTFEVEAVLSIEGGRAVSLRILLGRWTALGLRYRIPGVWGWGWGGRGGGGGACSGQRARRSVELAEMAETEMADRDGRDSRM
jgi:hypothetical protein